MEPLALFGETPGEFRPEPIRNPAQEVGNTGLKIQPADTLPRSRAPFTDPVRKPKLSQKERPTIRGNELFFDAGWKLIEAKRAGETGAVLSQPGVNTHNWYDATVPGTVLTTLVGQGVYPDPYYGLNNLEIPESLNKQDYWYRTEFLLPAAFDGRELWLDFKGINYYAEVWFNGHYVGHITGAFIRGKFDVTQLAESTGTNVIAVMVAPPPDPGIPSEQSVKFGPGDNGGMLCLDGPTFVCTEGWDWIPAIRDRDTGLWQDVLLRATGPVTIADPQIVTKLPLPKTSPASVTVQTTLHNSSDVVQKGALKGSFEGVEFEQRVTLQPRVTKTVVFAPADFPQLVVRQPSLWWPNGYGKPELYHLHLTFVTGDDEASDEQTVQFGIREMSYEFAARMPDGTTQRVEFTPTIARDEQLPVVDASRKAIGWDSHDYKVVTVAVRPGAEHSPALKLASDTSMGPYLVVKVNGQKIFCDGGNWGMDDALKRISRGRLEPYIRLHRDAHLDMIRNWVGQSTSEAFYDLCDKYGILVWNDFWMSTEDWNYVPVDQKLFLSNVADTIKRFRNHPCIALWCPRNEGVPPEPLNLEIDQLVRELDGTRYYQPNSRLVNLRTSGPWSNEPLEKYFTELNHGFSTELGASSIPSAEVMRSMMAKEDLWPPGDVWAYHDFHSKKAGNRDSILSQITRRYGEANNLDDLCRKAQMVNYETYRAIFEGFNSRLWKDCSGVLIWMSHPSWPSVVWQLYSWDYEPNASYFGAKKANEPVHIQMNLPDCEVAVINHRFEPLSNASATATIYDLSGHEEQTRKATVTAAANSCTDVFALDWPQEKTHFVKLELRDKSGRLLSQNFYWHARDEEQLQELNALPQVALKGQIKTSSEANQTVIAGRLTNSGHTPALAVKLTLRNAETGKRILPVYYDDNYFALLPGETRDFHIECQHAQSKVQVDLDGWNIEHHSLQ
ncbi:MAG TPA: glycoside hydrolase family 2 TIM barrel-domain containing protein [Verrucomicrobiae bacterium]|nr:glycoside hydrolase family 2 TIM barrel-domain containing protein [Verrucomicrobiae bacterium]